MGAGTESREIPHRPQTRAAAGLSPGGLRYAQTWHSQLANGVSGPSLEPGSAEAAKGTEIYKVTFAEDENSPA